MTRIPFRRPPQLPPIFKQSPESLIDGSISYLKSLTEVEDQIVATIKPGSATFESVLLPVIEYSSVESPAGVTTFLKFVSTSEDIRNASNKAQKLFEDAGLQRMMREDVFKLVNELYEKRETLNLDPESKYLLEGRYRDYILYGHNIPPGEQRDRFETVTERSNDLRRTCKRNQSEESGGIWYTREELAGLSDNTIATFRHGEEENEGKLFVSFQRADLTAVVKYAHDPDTRRRHYIGNQNKCLENVPLFKELIELRDEKARLLGYPDHASVVIEDRMMQTPKAVSEFLGNLLGNLETLATNELYVLKEWKRKDLEKRKLPADEHFFLWDAAYYKTLKDAEELSLDQEFVSEYFVFDRCLSEMLGIFEHLFSMKFVPIDEDDRELLMGENRADLISWHPDVRLYSVWNSGEEGDGFLGYLYVDPYPREKKLGHPTHVRLTSVRTLSMN
jgi:metallopeptidase MepB